MPPDERLELDLRRETGLVVHTHDGSVAVGLDGQVLRSDGGGGAR